MCGIFGVLGYQRNQQESARQALHTLTHRGPDQWGEHLADGIYLGHRRLSIRDLSENGRQPFVDAETGVSAIVNGEIWNDQPLRAELGEHRFRGRSDCEVLLHGYLTWGLQGLLERLDGFFGAAIHDPRSGELHLIKDRFGKKPLYYARVGEQWVFASEAKALLAYAPALRVFDLQGMLHWMSYRGSTQPGTLFKGVFKVPAAASLTLGRDNQVREQRYYDFTRDVADNYPSAQLSEQALDQRVENLLCHAIEKRFLADVPVGLQLSGGVDSSLLAVLTKEVHGERLNTYTVTFPGIGDEQFNEAAFARHVAEYCQFDHHEVPLGQADIVDAFPHMVWLFDGMLDIPNAIPIYLLSQQAKQQVTVMLTGEGADELFGGYGKFSWAPELAQRQPGWAKLIPEGLYDHLPAQAERLNRRLAPLYREAHYAGQPEKLLTDLNCFINPEHLEQLTAPFNHDPLAAISRASLARLPFAKQLQVIDQLTYLNFLLERQDKASMGGGIEARLPFLDHALISEISRTPSDLLYSSSELKRPLKRLLAKRLGKSFTYRTKSGFALPIASWLGDPAGLGKFVDKALSEDFLLWQKVDRQKMLSYLNGQGFPLRQLSYGDDERHWLRWFLAVLAEAQQRFGIIGIE